MVARAMVLSSSVLTATTALFAVVMFFAVLGDDEAVRSFEHNRKRRYTFRRLEFWGFGEGDDKKRWVSNRGLDLGYEQPSLNARVRA